MNTLMQIAVAAIAALAAGCDDGRSQSLAAAKESRFVDARITALEEQVRELVNRQRTIDLESLEFQRENARIREERAKHTAAVNEHNKWYAEAQEKYGALVFVGYDTNTATRCYRRCDGEIIRHKAPKDMKIETPKRRRFNRRVSQ